MRTRALSPARPARRPARRSRAGYTAVEVLMAMTVMAIGVAAVMSMEKAALFGDADARKTDVANAVARTWVERLRRDAMAWSLPSPSNPTGNNFASAPLLANHMNGQWFLPTDEMGQVPESMSPGFDILGRDLPAASLPNAPGQGGPIFCVNVRLQWLVPQALPAEPGLIRADVRVLWPRGLVNAAPAGGFCNAATAQLANPDPAYPPVYHSLYLSTTLKENPGP